MRRPIARLYAAAVVLACMACGPAAAQAQDRHVVRPGETLWGISRDRYGQPTRWPEVQRGNQLGEPRRLQPGMVLTLEPGIYVRPGEGVPEQFHNIGIRTEDDAIVTATGCELISRGVPVDADEIEALMRA